jgi:hypothetical protein
MKDELKQYLGDDARLLVMRYGRDAARLGFEDDGEAWLKCRTNFKKPRMVSLA